MCSLFLLQNRRPARNANHKSRRTEQLIQRNLEVQNAEEDEIQPTKVQSQFSKTVAETQMEYDVEVAADRLSAVTLETAVDVEPKEWVGLSNMEHVDVNNSEGTEDGWLAYWAEHGEFIIWNTWLEKYPDYINPDMLDNIAMPALREVEVTTEPDVIELLELDSDTPPKQSLKQTAPEDSPFLVCTGQQNAVTMKKPVESSSMSSENPESRPGYAKDVSRDVFPNKSDSKVDVIKVTEDLAALELTSTADTNEQNCLDNSETVSANIIFKPTPTTDEQLTKESESSSKVLEGHTNPSGFVATTEAEQNCRLVNMMHDYAGVPDPLKADPNEECLAQAVMEGEPYDDQWKTLWDGHCQEMYWYYYHQYFHWYHPLSTDPHLLESSPGIVEIDASSGLNGIDPVAFERFKRADLMETLKALGHDLDPRTLDSLVKVQEQLDRLNIPEQFEKMKTVHSSETVEYDLEEFARAVRQLCAEDGQDSGSESEDDSSDVTSDSSDGEMDDSENEDSSKPEDKNGGGKRQRTKSAEPSARQSKKQLNWT